jgi:hypothetical protein
LKKIIKILIFNLLTISCGYAFSQIYPVFGDEIPVTINGLTLDAMEPFISADGKTLFFNNLNDGITTSLFYAVKIDDTTFTCIDSLTGANQTLIPRLDAVASSDSANNFFWVSTRDYPAKVDNYFHGTFNGTDIINTGRLHGTFYIYSPGWLIMDAAISYDGTFLYYCNAWFNNCGALPCIAKLGIAQKQNDSTFSKLSNSDRLMQNINDTNYLVYAPNVTKDGLELYYTRILKSNLTQTEICVSVRTNLADTFCSPSVIYASTLIPEAPALTSDQSKMYYHKKAGSVYSIFMRYRNSGNGIYENENIKQVTIFPNPSANLIRINPVNPDKYYSIEVYSIYGQQLLKSDIMPIIDISNFSIGIYILIVNQENKNWITKIVKQ